MLNWFKKLGSNIWKIFSHISTIAFWSGISLVTIFAATSAVYSFLSENIIATILCVGIGMVCILFIFISYRLYKIYLQNEIIIKQNNKNGKFLYLVYRFSEDGKPNALKEKIQKLENEMKE